MATLKKKPVAKSAPKAMPKQMAKQPMMKKGGKRC